MYYFKICLVKVYLQSLELTNSFFTVFFDKLKSTSIKLLHQCYDCTENIFVAILISRTLFAFNRLCSQMGSCWILWSSFVFITRCIVIRSCLRTLILELVLKLWLKLLILGILKCMLILISNVALISASLWIYIPCIILLLVRFLIL